MFVSFFPRPKLLLYLRDRVGRAGDDALVQLTPANCTGRRRPCVGVATFWSVRSLWFDLYFVVCVAIFTAGWMWFSPHPWVWWSILGSALILFATYFQVQVSVAVNTWYGPFYDMIQAALSKTSPVTRRRILRPIGDLRRHCAGRGRRRRADRFFVSHYIFRWRTAMNDFYVANWPRLRTIEGASQRVQEDTMRFATITEGLGVNFISAILTLIAFLPVLLKLSSLCHRTAARRRDPLSAGGRRNRVVDLRNRRAGTDRHQAARHRVLQPAGRSGLPQGARARRRQIRPAPIRRR